MSDEQDKVIFSNVAHLHVFTFMTGFFGMFSEVAGAFESAIVELGTALSGEKPEAQKESLANFFTTDMEGMGNDVIAQLGETDYVGLYLEEAKKHTDFEQVKAKIAEIAKLLPSLKPLDEPLSSSELLAYTAVCKTDSKEQKAVDELRELFKVIFDKMQADADANR